MKNCILKEIRLDALGLLDKETNGHLRSMAENLANGILRSLDKIVIPNASVFLICFVTNIKDEELIEYGNAIGVLEARVFFEPDKFLHFNDDLKRTYLLERIKYSLLHFLKRQELTEEKIDAAITSLRERAFYLKASNKTYSKNKKYCCWVEILRNFHNQVYRLVCVNKEQESHYFIAEKVPEKIDVLKLPVEEMLSIPIYLKINGWINDIEFQMSWGREQYIFNAETKRITVM